MEVGQYCCIYWAVAHSQEIGASKPGYFCLCCVDSLPKRLPNCEGETADVSPQTISIYPLAVPYQSFLLTIRSCGIISSRGAI